MSKFVFVTGGVTSSLGKGVCVSSLGALLEAAGYSVSLQKIDPYLNVDPGTMSPFEHGEVYVTDDGGETDLDLGNYERFTHVSVSRSSSMTTGQVYQSVIENERRGDYLGKTVQIIPHVTDEIKRRIRACASLYGADVAIVEVGGTVGDIESVPFLEAIRQMAREEGRIDVAYVHLTLAPYLEAAEEMKSKPTQHSVKELRAIGIHPDVIVCRSRERLNENIRKKIALFCDVEDSAVISAYNAPNSIYEMPRILAEEGFGAAVAERLSLHKYKGNLAEWTRVADAIKEVNRPVSIAFVGKYVSHKDAYKSVYEALAHAAIANNAKITINVIDSEDLEKGLASAWASLKSSDGLLVPGGFGKRGIEGMILAVQYARENDLPTLGICLGMQCMAIEYARNVMALTDANSSEFEERTEHPIINLMENQKKRSCLGGTMRLGAFDAELTPGSLVAASYQSSLVSERHRHRYEFNNDYRASFEKAGMLFSGLNKELDLVEVMELPGKKRYLGVQYHPEFKSKPFAAHPLFRDFVKAAIAEE